ncbi:methylenetetrahydrofolate--tRNA-(uracil(54)-C(5))-methyltransferase (FADH(2)-oxidizing) TrmFO [Desulfovibrio sp. OttesenSCG-928-A18]|nr:methylenetetrahydrofolate--tRNA-(uracil(54)-C(5))-methyltransferase (FADH(2)-oxidizing) TrmFO [Desulfovibrio sp. OttesenSCG-928-A18]
MALSTVAVIGGGLAGCECAYALAGAGVGVRLFEMKPERFSPAHVNPDLGELVCSNSFRSDAPDSAVGVLKREMRRLDSLTMRVADSVRVPAGKALAVDRARFAAGISEKIGQQPLISVERREITQIIAGHCLAPPLDGCDAVVIAAGPLASDALAEALAGITGSGHLHFYDAIAPVVDGASVNMDLAFWGARYQPESRDYLNCPMNLEEYTAFHEALLAGRTFMARDFEEERHFEGCMPIEALAGRGFRTLSFGPLKPVGFTDPRSGKRPYALLQLRAENLNKSMFNLVGCQTKLTYPEQARIFRMIPGLEQAEFVRFGSMHRNTFVNAPEALAPDLSLKALPPGLPPVFLAGQITGVEGYVESAACGLWLGRFLAARAQGRHLPPPPLDSALGALLGHLRTAAKRFQPSNVQFGLMPELGVRAGKADRKALYGQRAEAAFSAWLNAAQPVADSDTPDKAGQPVAPDEAGQPVAPDEAGQALAPEAGQPDATEAGQPAAKD